MSQQQLARTAIVVFVLFVAVLVRHNPPTVLWVQAWSGAVTATTENNPARFGLRRRRQRQWQPNHGPEPLCNHRRCHRRRGNAHHWMISPQQLGSFEPLVRSFDTSTRTDEVSSGSFAVSSSSCPRPRVKCIDWTIPTGSNSRSSSNSNSNNNTIQTVNFATAWQHQKLLLQHHVDRLLLSYTNQNTNTTIGAHDDDDDDGTTSVILDALLLVEHTPVYTLGTGSDATFIKPQPQQQQQEPPSSSSSSSSSIATTTTTSDRRIPIVRMDRGGEVTYHGPGQLTIYPVLDLRNYRQDIHWYIRALEEVVLVALRLCGVSSAVRRAGVTGVWVHTTKVAAVGVGCKKWITQHGAAINVTPESVPPFDGIVPCGLVGCRVGCVNQFLPPDQHVTVAHMAECVKLAMADVFQLQLVDDDETDHPRRWLDSEVTDTGTVGSEPQ